MKNRFLASLLLLGLLSSLQSAFALTPPKYSAKCEKMLTSYGDDFFPEEELESFWDRHPRFGFLKKKGKIILVTKTEEMNLKLQGELAAWSKKTARAKKLKSQPIEDGVAYDVTALLPEISEFHWRDASRLNCWSLACYAAGVSNGMFRMDEQEFTFLRESPLARKLEENEEIRPGDMIVYRTPKQEIHAAYYVSENLALSKNGAAEGFIRLQDAGEVAFIYLHSMRKLKTFKEVFIEIYRFKTLDEYVEENAASVDPKLKKALADLRKAEELSVSYNVSPNFDLSALPEKEQDVYQEKWRQELREKNKLTKALAKKAETALAGKDLDAVQVFLWTMIRKRATGTLSY